MKLRVEAEKTLLVDGPASVTLLSGKAEILGAPMKVGEKLVIRRGKRAPIEVRKKASFDLMLGEGSSHVEVEGSTIPPSWKVAIKETLERPVEPLTVMVVGGVDSGKSSFCTYLANKALIDGLKVAVIDGDIGQSDVGPPSTIGYCELTSPVKDLFDVEAKNVYFVGSTSPERVINWVIEGLTTLKNEVLKKKFGLLVINTDGWIEGEEAIEYKTGLIEAVKPNFVVCIQRENELEQLAKKVKEARVLFVDSPDAVRKRDREKRKILRELGYKKHLRGGKVRSFPISWLKIERCLLGSGRPPTPERFKQIEEILQRRPLHCEESSKLLLIVLDRDWFLLDSAVRRLEERFEKRVKVIYDGEEEGLIVALKDGQDRFLGVGVLQDIDYARKVMKIYTPVKEAIAAVQIGQIKLDSKGREIGVCRALVQLND